MATTTSPRSLTNAFEPSRFARFLGFSGIAGITTGLGLEFYRLLTLDPVFGAGVAPEWLAPARFALLVGSVIAMVYAAMLDTLFEGWVDIVIGCTLAGQWGVPLSLYLAANASGVTTPFGFLALVCAGLFGIVGVAATINYARRCWPAPGDSSSAGSQPTTVGEDNP